MSWKSPKAYRSFLTDKKVKTKTSSHTEKLRRLAPGAHSLKPYSEKTGVPPSLIKQSYNRGMAAWRTGHRPGATQQQGGYARAASMHTCEKTYKTTDSKLVKKARKTQKGKHWFNKTCK